jgi:hypothetical protein
VKSIVYLITFLLIFTSPAWGKMSLNISIIHKKGIDKGLVIVSELHVSEKIDGDIVLELKSGLRIVLKAEVVSTEEIYGPSFLVYINGEIVDIDDEVLHSFSSKESPIPLKGERQFSYQDNEDQLLEILVRPIL